MEQDDCNRGDSPDAFQIDDFSTHHGWDGTELRARNNQNVRVVVGIGDGVASAGAFPDGVWERGILSTCPSPSPRTSPSPIVRDPSTTPGQAWLLRMTFLIRSLTRPLSPRSQSLSGNALVRATLSPAFGSATESPQQVRSQTESGNEESILWARPSLSANIAEPNS